MPTPTLEQEERERKYALALTLFNLNTTKHVRLQIEGPTTIAHTKEPKAMLALQGPPTNIT